MLTAFYFFAAMADFFLTIMIWFILEKEKSPAVYIDSNKVYAVVDVIVESNSSIQDKDLDEN